ncbi:Aminopeptidase [Temnothorax longispinosus]|uniref:Aminopeptidase n=1 Tax=Temnothorax longispinosus TaxID=300112 RepID=A0A4V3SA41_9HYME|nr:Aminopeptidase [Temnothorax longispinosus]
MTSEKNSTAVDSEFNSATFDNLWDAMQIALNEKNVIREPHDLKEVMNSWTQQKNYPKKLKIY